MTMGGLNKNDLLNEFFLSLSVNASTCWRIMAAYLRGTLEILVCESRAINECYITF